MEFFESAYNYVISAVIGILLALCAMLSALRVPKSRKYASYGKARFLLLLFFITIIVDLVLSLLVRRLDISAYADTIVDVFCYSPVGLLFLAIMQTMMEFKPRNPNARRIFVAIWLALSAVGVADEILYANNVIGQDLYKSIFMTDVVLWFIYLIVIVVCVVRTFREASHRLSNYYSDDVPKRMDWLMRSFEIFIIWGTLGPVIALGPSWLNTIWGGLGGGVYLYLAISFFNYGINYARLKAKEPAEGAGDADASPTPIPQATPQEANTPQILDSIKAWEENKGFRTPGVTIEMMASAVSTHADTLASVINEQYNCSFYDYVTNLRIRDAQSLLVHFADKDVEEIAQMTGFSSAEDMGNAFKQTLYVTPEDWRKGVLSLIS